MTKESFKKVLKTAVYLFVSSGLGAVIAYFDGNPAAFGIYTPIINIALVTIRQMLKTEE